MKNLLLIIFGSVVTQVISGSNTNVIESFAQIFEKLHKDASGIQSKTHGSVNEISRRLASTVRNTQYELSQQQNEAKAAVNEQMRGTLEQLHLLSDINKVNKCVTNNNDAIEIMIIKSEGGLQVCKNLNAGNIDDINVILAGVYLKEEKVHHDLEGSKILCNSTAKDTEQLRNCLYYQLFVSHINSVQELKAESTQIIKKYDSVFEKAEEKLKKCAIVVKKNIFEEVDHIALRFRNCCFEILQENQSNVKFSAVSKDTTHT